jgi:hypothetical protein
MNTHFYTAFVYLCVLVSVGRGGAVPAAAAADGKGVEGEEMKVEVEMDAGMTYENIRDWSFHLCRGDPRCARRFFVDDASPDRQRFNYLLDRFVVETATRPFLLTHFNSNCAVVREGWMYLMRTASFCSDNEVLDGDGYCTCRNGKVCHEAPSKKYSFDIVSLNVLFSIFLSVILYYSIALLRRLGRLEDVLQRRVV